MKDLARRLGRLEDTSSRGPQRFEIWATDRGWSTSLDTGEEIPSDELEARPVPEGTRRIEFSCDREPEMMS